jgi:hypothetical protein
MPHYGDYAGPGMDINIEVLILVRFRRIRLQSRTFVSARSVVWQPVKRPPTSQFRAQGLLNDSRGPLRLKRRKPDARKTDRCIITAMTISVIFLPV